MQKTVEPYRVVIGCGLNAKVFHETTMAACKALVSGLDVVWSIAQQRTNGLTNEVAFCGIVGSKSGVSAFQKGSQYQQNASRWMLETFKKSGMRKDVNNTTYISCEKFQMEMWEKKWGKCKKLQIINFHNLRNFC
jgi:hypothetical protein